MQTTCVRQGQIEVGVIEHQGRDFSALGATVQGRSITGYTKLVDGEIQLSSWNGQTTLESRSEIVERFWSGSLALMFPLDGGDRHNPQRTGERRCLLRSVHSIMMNGTATALLTSATSPIRLPKSMSAKMLSADSVNGFSCRMNRSQTMTE